MTSQRQPRTDGASPSEGLSIPPQLTRHLRDGRMVLFAGAGLSAMAGLPTWGPLLRRLIDVTASESMASAAMKGDLEQLLDAGKWLQIADHCKEQLGERYVSLLGEELRGDAAPIPDAHRLVMRLPFSAWVTTNYDKLLERAFAVERGGFAKTLTHVDADTLGTLLFDDVPYILKAHGDIDKPASIVFTSRDYRELIHGNAAFSMAFSAILLTRAVLFVGYSLSDPDFNLLLDRQLVTFRGFVPERYALMSGVGEVERSYLWRVARIRVIDYPAGRHELVTAFFRQLAEALDAGDQGSRARLAEAKPPSATVEHGLEPMIGFTRAASPGAPDNLFAEVAAALEPPALRLGIALSADGFRVGLDDGSERVSSPAPVPLSWQQLAGAVRAGGAGSGPPTRDALMRAGAALAKAIDGPALGALADRLRSTPTARVVLALDAGAAHVPWEYLVVNGGLLALLAPVSREPVGISVEARGLPELQAPLRALVVGNPSSGTDASLPGAEAEAAEIARLLRESGAVECVLLAGKDATVDAFRGALTADRVHIVHFAGHAWFDEDEAFLLMADGRLPVGMMRPWVARNPAALMCLNSHFTAFVPPGVDEPPAAVTEQVLRAGMMGKASFADLAMHAGVGAFVGSYIGALSDDGAKGFAEGLYRELLAGHCVADAVFAARRQSDNAADATGLAYSLHGHGMLRLPL